MASHECDAVLGDEPDTVIASSSAIIDKVCLALHYVCWLFFVCIIIFFMSSTRRLVISHFANLFTRNFRSGQ